MYSEDIFAIISLSFFILIAIVRLIQLKIYYEVKDAICVSYKKVYDVGTADSSGTFYECVFEWVDDSGNKHNLRTNKSFKPKRDKTYKILIRRNNVNKGYYIGYKYFLCFSILFFVFVIIGRTYLRIRYN